MNRRLNLSFVTSIILGRWAIIVKPFIIGHQSFIHMVQQITPGHNRQSVSHTAVHNDYDVIVTIVIVTVVIYRAQKRSQLGEFS